MDSTSILINIRKILRSVNLESKRIQKEFGLSIPQLLALNYLSNSQDYKATNSQLAKYLNLNTSTLTGIIARLEKKGWVAKIPNQKDKRITYIVITSQGLQQLKGAPQLMHQRLSQKLKKLSGEQYAELEKAFDLLIGFMEIEDIEASAMLTIDEISQNRDGADL